MTDAIAALRQSIRSVRECGHCQGKGFTRRGDPTPIAAVALQQLLDVCISMDAALDDRCTESDYRKALTCASVALGRPLPAALLQTWKDTPQ